MAENILLLVSFCEFLYVCDVAINIEASKITTGGGGGGGNDTSSILIPATTTTTIVAVNCSSLGDDEYNEDNYCTNSNCSNDYCLPEDEYIDLIIEHILPTPFEWIVIFMHVVTFVVGLVGNALVCIAVYKNRAMRNVTNYFIVNLAVADFMVILFCLPATVVWDVTETWFLGTALCKIVLYFQTVSVAVSVLTLTFISVDRWYAICFPLKFKSTTTRAKISIIIIWIVSLIIDIPELIALEARAPRRVATETHFFTQCEPSWSKETEIVYQILKIILLYTVPLFFMTVAYSQIVLVLRRSGNIPGHTETLIIANNSSVYQNESNKRGGMPIGSANETQLRSRKKAAKMLVAVVIMFAVCFLPVHLLSIVRYSSGLANTSLLTAISSIAHWLCYANSAINPIIYNFMSGKFRREFRRAFHQCHRCDRRERRPDTDLISQNEYVHSMHRRTSQPYAFSSRRTRTTSFITQTT